MPTDSPSALNALHLFSPSLPIGAFAFSQGLESAIELGWVTRADSLEAWCKATFERSIASLDFVYLARGFDADAAEWQALNDELLASRETFELLNEDRLLGAALRKWAQGEGIQLPEAAETSLVVAYGWVAPRLGITLETALIGLGWGWLENQMAVAAKAVPLGQTDLQSVIRALKPTVAQAAAQVAADPNIAPHSSVPLLTLISAQHETQYSRLFRS